MADATPQSDKAVSSKKTRDGSTLESNREAHLYPVPPLGHIVAYSIYPQGTGSPHASILGLAVGDGQFEVELDGKLHRASALIAAPGSSNIKSLDVPAVSFVFYPLTTITRSVHSLAPEPVKTLDRASFAEFDAELAAAVSGTLAIERARDLFQRVMARLAEDLPAPPEFDTRVARVVELLAVDSKTPVADLAAAVSLSADRLSHLFTEKVGLDLRRYRLWLKVEQVVLLGSTGKTLSEIADLAGFSDVAHLSRAIKDFYGGSPTQFNVIVHS